MMSSPVHSRFGSSSAPSPHRNELTGAENSGSEKHITKSGEGTHVEVDIVLPHVLM